MLFGEARGSLLSQRPPPPPECFSGDAAAPPAGGRENCDDVERWRLLESTEGARDPEGRWGARACACARGARARQLVTLDPSHPTRPSRRPREKIPRWGGGRSGCHLLSLPQGSRSRVSRRPGASRGPPSIPLPPGRRGRGSESVGRGGEEEEKLQG